MAKVFRYEQQTGYSGRSGNALLNQPIQSPLATGAIEVSNVLTQINDRIKNAWRVGEESRINEDLRTGKEGIATEFETGQITYEEAKEKWSELYEQIDGSLTDKKLRNVMDAHLKGERDRFLLLLGKAQTLKTIEAGKTAVDLDIAHTFEEFLNATKEKDITSIIGKAEERFRAGVEAGFFKKETADAEWDARTKNIWYQKFEDDLHFNPYLAKERFERGFYKFDPAKKDEAGEAIARKEKQLEYEIEKIQRETQSKTYFQI